MTHFERALELAERGRGRTGDHPLVGAVVVRDDQVMGEGWYEYEGVRHAEAIALEHAGDAARGATLFVTLELRSGPLEEELHALAAEDVQSLLLEGGPTLATAFLAAGLIDKLILFVAPVLAGSGPHFLGDLAAPLDLLHLRTEPSGEDVLLEAYLHEP